MEQHFSFSYSHSSYCYHHFLELKTIAQSLTLLLERLRKKVWNQYYFFRNRISRINSNHIFLFEIEIQDNYQYLFRNSLSLFSSTFHSRKCATSSESWTSSSRGLDIVSSGTHVSLQLEWFYWNNISQTNSWSAASVSITIFRF